MKLDLATVVVILMVGAIVLLLTMSARAGEHRGSDVVEVQSAQSAEAPEATDAATTVVEDEPGTVLFETSGTVTFDEPEPVIAPQTTQALLDALLAISPPAGWQLPAPVATDRSDWQSVDVGEVHMLVPPGWTIQNQIGGPGEDDHTIGLSPEALDLYVELRRIRNADNNYRQALVDHAVSEYSRSPDRLKEGVIFGFQPLALGGAAGHVEVMNQFGKERDEDGSLTFRLVLWRGRWERDGEFHRAEFTATFAQDRYDEFAPLVASILDTITVGPPVEPAPAAAEPVDGAVEP